MTSQPSDTPKGAAASTSNPPVPEFRPPGTTGPVLGVRPPRAGAATRATTAALSTPSTSPSSVPASDYGPDSGPLDPIEDAEGRIPTGTRSPADELDAAGVVEFDRGALRQLVRGVILGASHIAAGYLARTEEERNARVWIADESDQEAIGDPVVSVAIRHGGPEMANPDVADLLTAAFALAGYGVKHFLKSRDLRRAARRLASAGPALVEHPDAAA